MGRRAGVGLERAGRFLRLDGALGGFGGLGHAAGLVEHQVLERLRTPLRRGRQQIQLVVVVVAAQQARAPYREPVEAAAPDQRHDRLRVEAREPVAVAAHEVAATVALGRGLERDAAARLGALEVDEVFGIEDGANVGDDRFLVAVVAPEPEAAALRLPAQAGGARSAHPRDTGKQELPHGLAGVAGGEKSARDLQQGGELEILAFEDFAGRTAVAAAARGALGSGGIARAAHRGAS